MIRLMLIEDQQILLDSLADSLSLSDEIEIVAKSTYAGEVVELCEYYKPDLVLMDICNDEGQSGIVEAKRIKERFPQIKVILMTGMPDMSFVTAAKEAGADSFVYKNVGREQLLKSIQSTMHDYHTFPEEENSSAVELDLTEREMDILRLVCKGLSRKEISEALYLSENTVRNNINRILAKTGYSSIAQLAIFAVSKGYIVPEQI